MSKIYLESKYCFLKSRTVAIRFACLFMCAFSINSMDAQVALTSVSPTVTINFSSTIAGVENGTFTAAGFQSTPGVGQLDSDAWAITGWDFGTLAFGGTQTSNDYARGSTAAAQTTGGIYAYTGAPLTAPQVPLLMIQPGGSDFTPGTITLKIRNTDATQIMNKLTVSYKIYVRNDQNRSQALNFSYSSDDVTYTPEATLDYATPGTAVGSSWALAVTQTTTITGLSIPAGNYFYIRWTSDDIVGSTGARDELGLDDIILTASYPGACSPPATNATLNASTNILSQQADINFTRGVGTGGLLIVASPAPLISNPINGIIYSANSNYTTGTAISNGWVVYNSNAVAVSTAGSFTLTGLSPSTVYTLTLFEYQITQPCYMATGAVGTVTTSAASAIPNTDLFRSKIPGNWANAFTWEHSTNGISWFAADRIPTASTSASIEIQVPHTVDITCPVNMDNTTINGLLTLSTSGILNIENGGGTDVAVSATGTLKIQTTANYTVSFVYPSGTPQFSVAGLGKVTVGNGGSCPGYSPLGFTSGLVNWQHNSIFEWNTTDPFVTTSAGTLFYFPDAAPAVIPIFRVSRSPSLQPGATYTYGMEWNNGSKCKSYTETCR